MTTSELRSFPPVDDVLDTIRSIDGEQLRSNAKRDLRVIGKVLAFSGEQLHTFGVWLSEVWTSGGSLPAPLFLSVLFQSRLLAITFDFQIIDSNIAGISQIVPQNEDALTYLVEEAHFSIFSDGSAALFDENVGDFISDASWAHLACELV